MTNKRETPEEIYADGKRIFARAGNDPDLLELAVQRFDAALVERVREFYPSSRIETYKLFDQLQRDRIIDAEKRPYINWGHTLRNKSAHAKALTLKRSYVEDFAVAVKHVLDRTSPRDRKHPNRKPGFSSQPRPSQQRAVGERPAPPVRQPPPSPPPAAPAAAVTPQPPSSPRAESDDDFLRRLLSDSEI
jgi:hypothetical protein